MPIYQGSIKTRVLGYQELSVGAAAVALTVPQGTDGVLLRFALGPVRYTLDGSTPVGGSGFGTGFGIAGYDGAETTISAHAAGLAQFIRDGSVNGIVRAVFLAFQ